MNTQDWTNNQSCPTTSASHLSCVLRYAHILYAHIVVEGEAPIDGTVATEESAVNSIEGTETIQEVEGAGETEAEAEAEGEAEGVVEDPLAAEMNE